MPPVTQPENNTPEQTTAPVTKSDDSYDLDLDLLQPQPKKIRLDGKIYDIFPPRVKDMANLARMAGQLDKADDDNVEEAIGQLIKAFSSIMPGLKDDNVDLSVEQLTALFNYISSMVSPAENSALKTMGIEPTAEKKILAE